MRYGLPYKGSKNSIAEWIVRQLPYADTFVDLFFWRRGGNTCRFVIWAWARKPEKEVNEC